MAIAAAAPSLALAQEAQPAAPAPAKPAAANAQAAAVQTSIDRKSYSVAGDLQAQGGGAITDALRNIPAVQVDVQGNVSLRGDGNVTILVDGKPSSLFEGDNKAQALQ